MAVLEGRFELARSPHAKDAGEILSCSAIQFPEISSVRLEVNHVLKFILLRIYSARS